MNCALKELHKTSDSLVSLLFYTSNEQHNYCNKTMMKSIKSYKQENIDVAYLSNSTNRYMCGSIVQSDVDTAPVHRESVSEGYLQLTG
jgi:hypothetical protein